jgi:glycosyltransferase involved in cell wall biosynthesis
MKKRLFHLTYVLDPGGTENVLLRLLPQLEKTYENIVICMKQKGTIGDELEKKGVKVIYLGHERVWHFFRTFWRFRKQTRKYKPNVLNTYLPIPDIFGRIAGKLLKIPTIICHLRSTNKGRYNKVILVDYLTSFFVDKYTVNSGVIIGHYMGKFKFNQAKFQVIHNLIEKKQFNKETDRGEILKGLGIELSAKVTSCVANFHINKGHKYLVEAFEKIKDLAQEKNMHLLLIGDGSERENLEDQVKNYNTKERIHFLGLRNDVPDLLSVTEVFILPTFFEGLSNAIVEAMLSECAVITTDIPENEYLIKDGVGGFLVPVEDAEKLSIQWRKLIEEAPLRKKMGQVAHQTAEKMFDEKAILDQYKTLFG